MTSNFFTIGHSTRTLTQFVDLLRESRVDLVVDVRSIPRSRTNPQFNQQGSQKNYPLGKLTMSISRNLAASEARRATRTLAQRILAGAQLSELRGLRVDGAFRLGRGAT